MPRIRIIGRRGVVLGGQDCFPGDEVEVSASDAYRAVEAYGVAEYLDGPVKPGPDVLPLGGPPEAVHLDPKPGKKRG